MQRSARRKRTQETGDGTGTVYALPYRRVSGREQEREGLSLDAQQTDNEAVIGRQSWVLFDDYVDVMKGRRDDRPDYQRLLADVRRLVAEGKDVVVVVKWLDRLGRRLSESVRARDELKALGVRVYSVMEGGFVSDLTANILATVAEHEVERLGDRVAEAWDEPLEHGWHFVGRLSFGYQLRPRTEAERAEGAPKKVLTVDPVALPHVVRAYERADAGHTLQEIAADLAALPVGVRGKRALSHPAVRWLLSNPTYVARPLPTGDATPEEVLAQPKGRWPALVPDALWLAVQRRMAARRRLSPTNRASERYLLTGFLRCPDPDCGERMTGSTPATGRFAKYGRYTCSGKVLGANAKKKGCAVTATMKVVDEAVESRLLPLFDLADARPDVLRAAAREWLRFQQPATDGAAAKRVAQAERRRADLAKQRTEATRMRIKGEFSPEAYREAIEEIEQELLAVQVTLASLRDAQAPGPQLPPWEEALSEFKGRRGAWAKASVAEKRVTLTALVEKVVPRRIARGQYEVDVHWTPLGAALEEVSRVLAA